MKYTKRKIEVEAVQWNGDNREEIFDFARDAAYMSNDSMMIRTLEGDVTAAIGDYIIKGVKGELYPCKPDIFRETYYCAERPAGGFCNNLSFYRMSMDMNCSELAELCNISNQTILRYEWGQQTPTLSELVLLAKALKVSIDDLLLGEDKSN